MLGMNDVDPANCSLLSITKLLWTLEASIIRDRATTHVFSLPIRRKCDDWETIARACVLPQMIAELQNWCFNWLNRLNNHKEVDTSSPWSHFEEKQSQGRRKIAAGFVNFLTPYVSRMYAPIVFVTRVYYSVAIILLQLRATPGSHELTG